MNSRSSRSRMDGRSPTACPSMSVLRLVQDPEVPAGDLVRRQPQPRVPAVVVHDVAAGVLPGEQTLRLVEPRLGKPGPRHLADDLDPAAELDPAQLGVLFARI